MSERDQRLRERLDDVANASEQWAGYGVKTRTMSHADLAALLREASAALAQREAEIADLMRTLAGLEREASRLEDDREYNAGLCRAREAEITQLREVAEQHRRLCLAELGGPAVWPCGCHVRILDHGSELLSGPDHEPCDHHAAREAEIAHLRINRAEPIAQPSADRLQPIRRDLARLLDNLYGLHVRPGHIDAVLDVVHLHAPVKVPLEAREAEIADLRQFVCHASGCSSVHPVAGGPCNCGLEAALRAEGPAPPPQE